MRTESPVGMIFHRLKVLSLAESRTFTYKDRRTSVRKYVTCICDCGKIKEFCLTSLKRGQSKSCGCLQKEVASKLFSTHKMKKSPEYKSWAGLKQRALNPRNNRYADYGERGIKVCERWRDSFENFLADMGLKPSPQHSIDRIDVMGDYTPENCRWATPTEQARNRRTTVLIKTPRGEMCIKQAAAEYGLKYNTLCGRLAKGMSVESALTEPVRQRSK